MIPLSDVLMFAQRPQYIQQGTDTLPAMTANNSPAGHVASAGGGVDTFNTPPFRVFNKADQSDVDFVLQAPNTGWVQRKTPTAIRVWRFGVRDRRGVRDQSLKNFALYGSNDGQAFTLLRAVTGQTNWAENEERFFDVPKEQRAAYLYHRLEITANNGSTATALNELYLLQEVRR